MSASKGETNSRGEYSHRWGKMIPVNPFSGVKRFVGDKRNKIVHDLLFEAKSARVRSCSLGELRAKDAQIFDPDTLDEAKSQGFSPCPVCLWTEHGPGE